MKYSIYQTSSDDLFLSWEKVKDRFSLANYEMVYSGDLAGLDESGKKKTDADKSDFETLEELYVRFNIDHPLDYHARSLSVSDVVEFVRGGSHRFYFCDSVGWKRILEDLEEKEFAFHMEQKQTKKKRIKKVKAVDVSLAHCKDVGYDKKWMWTGSEPWENVADRVAHIGGGYYQYVDET
jgi:hypothetical protein